MNKTLILSSVSVITIAATAALVPVVVNAQAENEQNRNGYGLHAGSNNSNKYGNQGNNSLESRAKSVNMTADQLTKALQTRTMNQIREDQGVSLEDYQASRQEATRARWQSKGFSEEEVQKRVEWQQQRQEAKDGECDGSGQNQGGYGRQNQ